MTTSTSVTKDQALCMFFYVEYAEKSIKKYTQKLEKLSEHEICHNADPRQPILVSMQNPW